MGGGNLTRSNFDQSSLFKAKSNILYIIKISMTCVCKEYEGKIALTTAKNKRFIGL